MINRRIQIFNARRYSYADDGIPRPDMRGAERFSPKRPGDVGHDLEVVIYPEMQTLFERFLSWVFDTRMIILWPMRIRNVASGLHLIMNNEMWCEVRARSSTALKRMVVIGGTIDSGYHGELYTVLHNVGIRPRLILEGERYSQVVFIPAVRPIITEVGVNAFNTHVEQAYLQGGRAGDGFGSTGR